MSRRLPGGADLFQGLIDREREAGGLAIWAHPEALYAARGAQESGVEVCTPTYVELLLRTYDYAAFEGMYADVIRVARPGGEWDYLLTRYARGDSSHAPWLCAGSDYHSDERGELTRFTTVVWAEAREERAVLSALEEGRFYSSTAAPSYRIVLEQFSVLGVDPETETGVSGERVVVTRAPILQVGVRCTDGKERRLQVRILRNGEVIPELTRAVSTPHGWLEEDSGLPVGRWGYYRVEVKGLKSEGALVLSNPIFVYRKE